MTLRRMLAGRALTWFWLGAAAWGQYSTPVGTGASKAPVLRATAVLEWTGALEKPSASRLMPIAVWDGEHYQPAGLYLAQPAPMAFEAGTQYELERAGEPAGLFEVRTAAELHGAWIGMGKFQPEKPPPPPPKLKASKELPALSGGGKGAPVKDSGSKDAAGAAKPEESAHPASAGGAAAPSGQSAPGAAGAPAGGEPTLHRRTADESGAGSDSSGTTAKKPEANSDPDRPTLHKRDDDSADSAGKAPAPDPDRPTLHRPAKTDDAGRAPAGGGGETADEDRPTLHHGKQPVATTSSAIDPDRPRLRHGVPEDGPDAVVPVRLEGEPPAMQQIVAVSDTRSGEARSYRYQWSQSGDAAKMQAALSAIAEKAVRAGAAATTDQRGATFGPASRGKRAANAQHAAAAGNLLVDEQMAAYELTFSGGVTLVYTAHTQPEGAQRSYVTLIAQPDFAGVPQILLKRVSRGDRLDESPVMHLIDALDTDDDDHAELIFELAGGDRSEGSGAASTPAHDDSIYAKDSRGPERQFAIYKVAAGRAVEVFNTGPLP